METSDGIFVFPTMPTATSAFLWSMPTTMAHANHSPTIAALPIIVSASLANKTFSQRMTEANFTSLDGIKEAFSVEKVTKEFYADISNWFDWALQTVISWWGKGCWKGFEMSVFAWSPGWSSFGSCGLRALFQRICLIRYDQIHDCRIWSTKSPLLYYQAILQNLFFCHPEHRGFQQRELEVRPWFKNMQRDYGKSRCFSLQIAFSLTRRRSTDFKDIPFLNGGLFTCLDVRKDPEKGINEEIFIDGFSDNPKHQAHVPNRLFFAGMTPK